MNMRKALIAASFAVVATGAQAGGYGHHTPPPYSPPPYTPPHTDVPEPGDALLLAAGVSGFVALRRRRKAAARAA